MIGFFPRLFPKHTLLPFAVVLLAVSIAASTTGLLLVGASTTVADSSGGGSNIITIYSSASKLPITSIVPLSLSNEAGKLPGVIQSTPEAVSPVLIDNRTVIILRGMNLTAFSTIYKPLFISGRLDGQENSTVFLGSMAAANLGLNAGSRVRITGLMASYNISATVGGIFTTGTALDDEVVSSIAIGQEMRGLGGDQASLVSLEINPSSFSASSLAKLLIQGQNTTKIVNATQSIQNSLLSTGVVGIGDYLAGNPSQAVGQVLSRAIGLSQDVLWALVAIVSVCSALSIYYSVSWAVTENSDLIRLLNSLGLTRGGIVSRMTALTLIIAVPLSVIGYLLSLFICNALVNWFKLTVLFHTMVVVNSLPVLALVILSTVTIVIVSNVKLGFSLLHENGLTVKEIHNISLEPVENPP